MKKLLFFVLVPLMLFLGISFGNSAKAQMRATATGLNEPRYCSYENLLKESDVGGPDDSKLMTRLPYCSSAESTPTVIRLPWSFDGEGVWNQHATGKERFPEGWDAINGGNTYYSWKNSTTAAHSGRTGIYFQGVHMVSTKHDDWLITPQIAFSGNEEVTLWVKSTVNSSTSYYKGRFTLYASTDGATSCTDTAHFEPLTLTGEDIVNNYIEIQGKTWKKVTFMLPSTLSGNRYLAFVVKDINSYSFCIDDIDILTLSSCPTPTNLKLDKVLATTATISCTSEGESFIAYYGPKGFDLATADSSTSSTSVIQLTGLTPNTEYDVVVCTRCSDGVLSNNTGRLTFKTSCSPLQNASLPLCEDFADNTPGIHGTLDPCWIRGTNSSTTYPYVNGTEGNLNPNSLYFYRTASSYCYLALPLVEASVSSLVLSGNVLTNTVNGYLLVGTMSNPYDTASFVAVDTIHGSNVEKWRDFQVSLENVAPNTGEYVAIMMPQGSPATYVNVDNLMLSIRGNCNAPMNLAVSAITDSSANVSWVDTVGSSWTIYYGLPGFNPDTVQHPIVVTSSSAMITGLQSQVEYEFLVKTNCEDGTKSIPSMRQRFKTICEAIDILPFSENFESYDEGQHASFNTCWFRHSDGVDDYNVYPTQEAAITGTRGLLIKTVNQNTLPYCSYVALPSFNAPINTLCVSFNMKGIFNNRYNVTNYSKLAVGVMSNPNDISTFDTIEIIDMSDEVPENPQWHEILFDLYQGEGRHIAFLAMNVLPKGSDQIAENVISIDDLIVDRLPSCRTPKNLILTEATASTLSFTWSGNSSSYEVKYATNADMSNSTIVATQTNSCQLTDLSNYTYYYVSVRGICNGNDASAWMHDPIKVSTMLDCGVGFQNLRDTIGEGNLSGTDYSLNANKTYTSATTWTIFTEEELGAMGLVGNNNIIKSIALKATEVGSPLSFQIYMTESDAVEFKTPNIDTISTSQMTLVYDGTIQFKGDVWSEIRLTTPFRYKDSANLMIAFVRNDTIDISTKFSSSSVTDQSIKTYAKYISNGRSRASSMKVRSNIIFNVCADIPSCIRPLNLAINDVSENSISLSWTGSAANYEIAYGVSDFDPNNITTQQTMTVAGVADATIQNAIIPSLTSQQTYYIYVRSLCSDTDFSIWSSCVARTACALIDLPYSENFDSYSSGATAAAGQVINECWTKGTTHSILYPYLYNRVSYSPNNSLILGADASSYSYVALPRFNESITNIMMTYMLHRTSYSGAMYVGVMNDPNDINTFTLVAIHTPSDKDIWEFQEVDFSSYTGSGKYIALMAPDSINVALQIDDIEVYKIPTCKTPTNVAISAISSDTALVSWTDRSTATNGYEIEYGVSGFELGEGSRVVSSTNPTILRNLAVGSNYDVYVRSICSDTDTSRWSTATSFTTVCGPMALPLIYNFDNCEVGASAELPNCFTRFNDAVNSRYASYPYVNKGTSSAHSGNNYLYFMSGRSVAYASQNAMIFPEIDTVNYPINNSQISFWARRTSSPSQVIVGVVSNTSDLSTFVGFDTIDLTSQYTEYVVKPNNYTGNGTHFVIKQDRPLRYSYTYIYVDDVVISEIPACPLVYDLDVKAVSATTATVGWSDTIGTTNWILDYHEDGSDVNHSMSVNTNPYTITGLTANTQYYFNVRPICASGDTSFGVMNEATFKTSQVPVTLPYNYGFEDASEWANWQTNSNCNVNWYRGAAIASQGTNAMYVSADNGVSANSNWATIVNTAVYRDIDFGADTSSFTMKFKAIAGGKSTDNRDGIAIMLVDPKVMVEASTKSATTPWGSINNALTVIRLDSVWTEHMIYFEHIAGIHRLAFCWYNTNQGSSAATITHAGAIDDISIVEQSCIRPIRLTVSNIESSTATLSWDGAASNYEVVYHMIGDEEPIEVKQNVQGNSLNLQDLISSTTYEFSVRAICAEGDTSYWANPVTFRTICTRYHANDTIRENFDSIDGVDVGVAGIVPPCWDAYIKDGVLGNAPRVVNSGRWWYSCGGNSLLLNAGGSYYGTKTAVAMPYTVEPVSSLTVSFWLCTEYNKYGTLEVGYLVGDDFENDFVAIESISASALTMHSGTGQQAVGKGVRDTVQFTTAPENARRIAFRWNNVVNIISSATIDDVVITSNVTCNAPRISNTTVDEVSATITWNGEASNYQLLYKESADSDWSDTISTNANIYTFTNLLPSTDYVVRLRALCGNDDGNSLWTSIDFTTSDMVCETPLASISNITSEGATITWNKGEYYVASEVNVFNATLDSVINVTDTSLILSNLSRGTEYNVAVRVRCSENIFSDWCDTLQFTTLDCLPISNVVVSNINFDSATISWTAVEGQSSWEVSYGVQGTSAEEGVKTIVSATRYNLTGLTAETTYDVYVRAKCDEDFYSDWSEVTSFTTTAVPGVTNVTISDVSDTSAVISWNAPEEQSSWEVSYGVQGTSAEAGIKVTLDTTTYNLINLVAETTYDVYVRAKYGETIYSKWSTLTSFTTEPTPVCDTVSDVVATNVTIDSATISWTAVEGQTSWEVSYGVQGTSVEAGTKAIVSATNYILTGLDAETSYDVYVRARCDEDFYSEWSAVTTFTTTAVPTVENIVVSDVTDLSAIVSWTAVDKQSSWEVSYGVQGTSAEEGTKVTLDTTTYNLIDLTAETAYDVYIRAKYNEFYSDWTLATFTTEPTPVCDPVSDVVATNVTIDSATISWTAVEGQTSWEVSYGVQGTSAEAGTKAIVSATNYILTGLDAETSYDVYVRARCDEDFYSEWSDVVTFTTLESHEGIDGVEGNFQFTIYPNPTSNATTISLNGVEGKVVISVVDMNGRTVANEAIECGVDCEKRIDVSGLSQGTYFVRVLGDNINSVRKLIVR